MTVDAPLLDAPSADDGARGDVPPGMDAQSGDAQVGDILASDVSDAPTDDVRGPSDLDVAIGVDRTGTDAVEVGDAIGGCSPGTTRPCYGGPSGTRDRGVCRAGTQLCGPSGTFDVTCLGEHVPAMSEICGNAMDDDCDGEVDEGCGDCAPGTTRACYSGPSDTRGVGRCLAGVQVCSPAGAFVGDCLGERTPSAVEACGNTLDDDCDGAVDEGCGDCTPGATRACYSGPSATRDAGRCRSGTQICGTDRQWMSACVGELLPAAESCNSVDDDCDGAVDDDSSATLCTVPNAIGRCGGGSCGVGSCRAGFADCDSAAANGCEADLASPSSCGRCFQSCTSGRACRAGECVEPTVGGVGAPAVGEDHACVILTEGRVVCWGATTYGQLGAGPLARSTTTPTFVLGLSGAIGLDAGSYHTCAVSTAGSVSCWGRNEAGQLGDGTSENRSTFVNVVGLGDVVQVALGGTHTCALRRGGTVVCWGANASGQLGDGTTTARSAPTEVTGISQVVRLAAGENHTCAVLGDGTARCWGLNTSGQLGDGTSTNRPTPTVVAGLTSATEVAIGATHSCAVVGSGGVRCWGANVEGQIGDGTSTQRLTPVSPTGLNNVTELSAGSHHTCARKTDGEVWCWGQNFNSTPRSVASDILHVAAGGSSNCGVSPTGRTICWGRNSNGQLGDGTRTSRTSTTTVLPVFGLSGGLPCSGETCNLAVVASPGLGASTYAFRPGGMVASWGLFSVTRSVASRRFGPEPDDITGVRALSIGHDGRVCVLSSAGTVRCRIAGGSGLEAVPGISDAVELGIGDSFGCVRRLGGVVGCWGSNEHGRLGDGTSSTRTTPSLVGGSSPINDVTALAIGSDFACAMRTAGTVWCWGNNSRGQLGDGTTNNSWLPMQVRESSGTGFLSGVTHLVAGGQHVCALKPGEVRCWGYNSGGQLGDGSTVNLPRPGRVSGLTDAIALSAGEEHTCALRSGGTVSCWGDNTEGALGDGTTVNRSLPVDVMGLADVTMVSAGARYACARLRDGGVRCWGRNNNGELGDGTGYPALTPRGPIFGLP